MNSQGDRSNGREFLLSRDEAKQMLRPHEHRLSRAHLLAFDRVREISKVLDLSRSPDPAGSKVTWANIRQSAVLDAVRSEFSDLESKGDATWEDLNGLSLLRLRECAPLRFNKIDADHRPCRNRTRQSAASWSTGLLFDELYWKSSDGRGQLPVLTVGSQWDDELFEPPTVFAVLLDRGATLWSISVKHAEADTGRVLELKPQKADPDQSVRVQLKKSPDTREARKST